MYKWLNLWILVGLLACGCASRVPKDPLSQHYYRIADMDTSRIGPTVILELNNESEFSRISEDATDALFQAMQQGGLLGLDQIDREDPEWESLDLDRFDHYTLEQLAKVREALKCRAVLYGSVTKFTPYPHLTVGLSLKLIDLDSGAVQWVFEYIWDTANEDTLRRLDAYYTQKNMLGLTKSRDRLGAVSSIKLMRFVAYEISQTLDAEE
ncbi:MAG: hypothetical protein GY809_11515 [Planctomycetes bacterium]|nr:hypothetical protein [Planctomycetota bacterium]